MVGTTHELPTLVSFLSKGREYRFHQFCKYGGGGEGAEDNPFGKHTYLKSCPSELNTKYFCLKVQPVLYSRHLPGQCWPRNCFV